MTFEQLLKDQGVDPKKLLKQPVGGKLEKSGGITANLADGQLDIHIIFEAAAQSG